MISMSLRVEALAAFGPRARDGCAQLRRVLAELRDGAQAKIDAVNGLEVARDDDVRGIGVHGWAVMRRPERVHVDDVGYHLGLDAELREDALEVVEARLQPAHEDVGHRDQLDRTALDRHGFPGGAGPPAAAADGGDPEGGAGGTPDSRRAKASSVD